MSRTTRRIPQFITYGKRTYKRFEGKHSDIQRHLDALDELGEHARNRDRYVATRGPSYHDDITYDNEGSRDPRI